MSTVLPPKTNTTTLLSELEVEHSSDPFMRAYWRKRLTQIGFVLFLLMPFIVFPGITKAQDLSPDVQRQLKSLLDEKASRTPDQLKINSQIWYAYKMLNGDPITSEVASLQTGIDWDGQGYIKSSITARINPTLIERLENLGCRIISAPTGGDNITATIPLVAVEEIAALSDILYIDYWFAPVNQSTRPRNDVKVNSEGTLRNQATSNRVETMDRPLCAAMSEMVIGSVTSEGDVTHGADLARAAYGLSGAGIKIGVISDSYDNLDGSATNIVMGDLPGPNNPYGYTTQVTVLTDYVQPDTTFPAVLSDEGRAMLQIVHDLAPAAELYFATAYPSQTAFAQAIIDLRNAGCDIIVDDISYLTESVWIDGLIAQAINQVTDDGALYFSSVGNSGNLNGLTSGVWEGDFVDGGSLPLFPGGSLHNFGGGTLYNTLTLPGLFYLLTWSDPWGSATNDYDLFVTNSTGTAIVASSMNGGTAFPLEWITAPLSMGMRFYILRKDGSNTSALRLTTNQGLLSNGTSGATFGHNACQNAIAVAATGVASTYPNLFSGSNMVEAFSSDGLRKMFYHPDGSPITPGNLLYGTNGGINLQKPDITAADGVMTSMTGFDPFFGTSAAAPHAAAIAALVMEAAPNYTADEIKNVLFNATIDIEAPGDDRDAGRGILMAMDAITSLGLSLENTFTAETSSPLNNGNGILEPGEVGSFNFTLSNNTTTAFTDVNATLTSSIPGVTIIQGNFNLGTIPGSGEYISNNQFGFVTTQALPCGTKLDFIMTVDYEGGGLAPQQTLYAQSMPLGNTLSPINGTLGSPPPLDPNYSAYAGQMNGSLSKYVGPGASSDLGSSSCENGIDSLVVFGANNVFPYYHAFVLSNTNEEDSVCITVTGTVPANTLIYRTNFVSYNSNGFNPSDIDANVIGHTSVVSSNYPITKSYTFIAPPGEEYTVVVGGAVNSPFGYGAEYTLQIDQQFCSVVPCIGTDPMVLSPEPHVAGVNQFQGTAGLPFSQIFSATGGSGLNAFYTDPANIPPGLSLTQNGMTATLSGIPTGPFGTPPTGAPWALAGADATGCGNPDVHVYYIQINPCMPVSISSPASNNGPICGNSGNTLNLSVSVAGQEPYTYAWSGPPGAIIINGNTATPNVLSPVSGDYTVTVTNFCGSVTSTTTAVVNTAPFILVPGPFAMNTDPGECYATLNVADLYSFVTLLGSPTPQLVFTFNPTYPTGMSSISASATNVCGNAQATIEVVVSDIEAPTVVCPSNITINSEPEFCGAIVSDYSNLLTATDNCGSPELILSGGMSIGDTLAFGTHIVTYTAIDESGNSSTCNFTVTVEDDVKPVMVCQNIATELINGQALITAVDIDNGTTDPCGLQALTLFPQDPIILTTASPVFNFVTLQATDFNGNTASCSAVVTIVEDLCPGGSDGKDSDHAGLPDDCDCSPFDAFNDKIILHQDHNTAMDFDGTNDHLSIPNEIPFNPTDTTSITFEAWIKPNLSKQFNTILSKGHGAAQTAYIFNTANYNTIGLFLGNAGGGGTWFYADTTLLPDVWMHVAAVYNHHENTLSFYLNGSLVNTEPVPYTPFSGDTQPLFIGQQGFGCACNHFDGQMEEVRIWSRARTTGEILQYSSQELKGWEKDLVAYYRFNDGIPDGDNTALTTVHDQSPYAHHAMINGMAQNGVASNWTLIDLPLAVINQDTLDLCLTCPDTSYTGLDFDGIDDEIIINHDPAFIPQANTSFSFEAWIKPVPGPTAHTILSKGAGSGATTSYIFSILQDKIALFMGDGSQATWIYSNTTITFNEWNHVAVVYDGNTGIFTFYLNGTADGQATIPHGFFGNTNPLYIGRQGTVCNCNHFLGQMDEVRIWREARTASQIANQMYISLSGSEINLAAYYTFNHGTPSGDNTATTTLPDASRHGRDGTLVDFAKTGTTSNWVSTSITMSGPQNAALDFDGTNDFITIPNHPDLIPTATNAVTFEAWIHPAGDPDESFITASGIWPDRNHQIYLLGSQLWVTGTGVSPLVSIDTIPFEKWTHIAVVFDMTETRLYINGQLDQTRVQTLAANNLGYDVTLGNQENGGPSNWNFLGKMDDVRYWDHARTATEIGNSMHQELRGNEDGLAAYYNFNEGNPAGNNTELTAVFDIANNGHNGTLAGFQQTGSSSNWVSSPFNYGDGDQDGVPDFCDHCVPLKTLHLENHQLQGIYKASEEITLGTGLTLPASGDIEFRAPRVEILQLLPNLPSGVSWLITPLACPED